MPTRPVFYMRFFTERASPFPTTGGWWASAPIKHLASSLTKQVEYGKIMLVRKYP